MQSKTSDWIERNIKRMMQQIYVDARLGKPLPVKITMHPIALDKFIRILKSKDVYFPDQNGTFKFIGIEVKNNSRLPMGTFVVERFSDSVKLVNQ